MQFAVGIIFIMMPLAVIIGFGSKRAASRSARGWIWLKVACQTALLGACLYGLIASLQLAQSGQDLTGLFWIFIPASAMGGILCASAIFGNLIGIPRVPERR